MKVVQHGPDRPSLSDVWGTGAASPESLYVDEATDGIVLAAGKYDHPAPIVLGTGEEITIRELVTLMARVTPFEGEVRWDPTKPDGRPRRGLDTRRARGLLGFVARMPWKEGLRRTIEWYESAQADPNDASATPLL